MPIHLSVINATQIYKYIYDDGVLVVDVCRTVDYLTRRQGQRLTAHIIRSVDVNTDSNCQIECFLEAFCMSYNIGPFQGGKHVCELSNSDAIRHPQDLVSDPTYAYMGTKVSDLFSLA